MNDEHYIIHLETVVESLLAERPPRDIAAISELPQYRGFTFSPHNIRELIERKRLARLIKPD